MSLTGVAGLIRALQQTPEIAKEELRHVVSTTAFAIAQRMRATVQRASGLLASNIGTSQRGLTGYATIGVDAFYWHFLEYGTVKMGAKPFVRPSGELEAPIFEQRIKAVARAIEQRIERAAA